MPAAHGVHSCRTAPFTTHVRRALSWRAVPLLTHIRRAPRAQQLADSAVHTMSEREILTMSCTVLRSLVPPTAVIGGAAFAPPGALDSAASGGAGAGEGEEEGRK